MCNIFDNIKIDKERWERERVWECESACMRDSNFSGKVNLLTQQQETVKKWYMIYDSSFELSTIIDLSF